MQNINDVLTGLARFMKAGMAARNRGDLLVGMRKLSLHLLQRRRRSYGQNYGEWRVRPTWRECEDIIRIEIIGERD